MSEQRGLPAGWYRDPAQAAREAATIFARGWQFVCHASDLPSPGTAARFDCAGRSLFVLRKADGGLRAFRNACVHRGMRLIEGDALTGLAFCLDARVRCPYHGWTYDDHGALVAATPCEGVAGAVAQAGGRSLREAHVEQWRGLVFAAFDTPRTTLAASLGPAANTWPDAATLRRVGDPLQRPLAADWKLVCQHLLDGAHAALPTRAAWRLYGAAQLSPADGADALRGTAQLAVADAAAWSARAYRRIVAALQDAPAAEEWLFIWPNLLLLRAPDGLLLRQALPGDAGACVLREIRYGAADTSRAMRLLRYARERVLRRSRNDAALLVERTQRGVAALDADDALGVDADSEPGLAWFAQRCLAAHDGTAPAGTPAPRKGRARRTATATA